jgi:hypothetical protein
MRLLVCGGRRFSDRTLLNQTLDALQKTEIIDVLIEGNATGADRLAGCWARTRQIDNLKFPADWAKHGRAAGPIRNQKMLTEGRPDLVIAFAGGKGTSDIVKRARAAGVIVIEISACSARII